VTYLIAIGGLMLLIVLHELGHFTAAKAVGMRVERFSLFFPPLILRKTVGETEYAIGALPLGGYVKISGMSPAEDLPDEVRTRAYYSQPVWKRIVVIAAGPAVNLVLALVLLFVFFVGIGASTGASPKVGQIETAYPAHNKLQLGDRIVSVDGKRGAVEQLSAQIGTHKCAQVPPVKGCRATTPVHLVVQRHGQTVRLAITPIYDPVAHKTRLGFGFDNGPRKTLGAGKAASVTLDQFWYVTKQELALPARLLHSRDRKQLSGLVGTTEVAHQTLLHDPGAAVALLAIVSLALAIINLFPFLPLDGGHIFWALVELVRRRPVPYSLMERAGVIGFVLIIMLFLIGFTNDIDRLTNGGFNVR
jgi:regulator of sigma E protease